MQAVTFHRSLSTWTWCTSIEYVLYLYFIWNDERLHHDPYSAYQYTRSE